MKLESVRIKYEVRDMWVGVFWDRVGDTLRVYVCLLPMLPIIITLRDTE